MTIPFIRMQPNGKTVAQTIKSSAKVEREARAFIERGGRYLIEIVPDPANPGEAKVVLMATCSIKKFGVPGVEEVAHLECKNGPELPRMVDELVWQSIRMSPDPEPEGKIIQFEKPGIVV